MADSSNSNYDSYGNPKPGILKKMRMPAAGSATGAQRSDMSPEEQAQTPEEGAQSGGFLDTVMDALNSGKENLPPHQSGTMVVGGMGYSGAAADATADAAQEAGEAEGQGAGSAGSPYQKYRPTQTQATTGFQSRPGIKAVNQKPAFNPFQTKR